MTPKLTARDRLEIGLFPSVLTATVATLGYSGWIRFKRGSFPPIRYTCAQFAFSLASALWASFAWLEGRDRNHDALKRMMANTDKRIEIISATSGTSPIPIQEYDDANGVDTERKTVDLMNEASTNRVTNR